MTLNDKFIAKCLCGKNLEMWIPPCVICPSCKSVYAWSTSPVCVASQREEYLGMLAKVIGKVVT